MWEEEGGGRGGEGGCEVTMRCGRKKVGVGVGRGCEVTTRCGRKKVCVGMEEDKEWKGWYVVGCSHVNNSPVKT